MNKEEQKKLLIETMEADEKDGLYKQQTAVDWLVEQYEKAFTLKVNNVMTSIIEQAKQMEKEQINKACYDGYYKEDEKYTYEYYNETYGK